MLPCAYCETNCIPTREHLVPAWYCRDSSSDGFQVFNARRPTTHIYGSIEIKDVCNVCNNKHLSALDQYGMEVFERYLKIPAYLGETADFEVDRSRFVRWLLKLCYNSARVHNADVTVLRKYRRFILGLDPTPEPIVYVSLVTTTDFSTSPPSPARRIIGGHPDVVPPHWFRLTQFRGDPQLVSDIVQRQVYIDSYCFTLFAIDPDDCMDLQELPQIESQFKRSFGDAQVIPASGRLKLTAGKVHALATVVPHMRNFPARYSDGAHSANPDFAHAIGKLVDGDVKLLCFEIKREEVESNDVSEISNRLNELVETRESAMASMQRVAIFASGYDDDVRELWEIPEVRRFVQRLFTACPHLFFLALPESGTIEWFLSCCCDTFKSLGDDRIEFDPEEVNKFLEMGFGGLNKVTQQLAISVEVNRAITDDVFRLFADV